MTSVRGEFGLAVHNGELWAVGGTVNSVVSSCERLDQASGTWVAGPNMTSARFHFGLVVHNGELWAVGGSDGHIVLSSCERLDAASFSWVPAPSLPKKMTCCVVSV